MIRRQLGYFARKLALMASLIFISAIFVSCTRLPATPAPQAEITAVISPERVPERVGLSDSAVALVDVLEEAANESIFEANVAFIKGNDEILIADVREGQLAAALVYSIPETNTLWFNPVALDGLTVIGHPDNPLNELSLESIAGIFQGQITNWAEVGGNDSPISVYVRESGSGVRETFHDKVPRNGSILGTAIVVPGQELMLGQIQLEESAIGLSMMTSSEGVKSFDISGIPAHPDETSTQHYPLSTPLYFVSQSDPKGELRTFLSWLQSAEGQSYIGDKFGRLR
jgi:hypothetical protein